MATWARVRKVVAELPDTQETTSKSGLSWWTVRNKSIAWARPLRNADDEALGDAAPDGPILGVRTADVITDAWLCRAPKRLVKEYLAVRG